MALTCEPTHHVRPHLGHRFGSRVLCWSRHRRYGSPPLQRLYQPRVHASPRRGPRSRRHRLCLPRTPHPNLRLLGRGWPFILQPPLRLSAALRARDPHRQPHRPFGQHRRPTCSQGLGHPLWAAVVLLFVSRSDHCRPYASAMHAVPLLVRHRSPAAVVFLGMSPPRLALRGIQTFPTRTAPRTRFLCAA